MHHALATYQGVLMRGRHPGLTGTRGVGLGEPVHRHGTEHRTVIEPQRTYISTTEPVRLFQDSIKHGHEIAR